MILPKRRANQDLDVIVVGRAGLDLYPWPVGTRTDLAQEFRADMGGSAGNIAVALARAGARVGLAAPISADPVGEFVAAKLAQEGIVHLTPQPVGGQARTSLALAELIAQGSRTVIYRNDAADLHLDRATLDPHLGRAPVVLVTGTALAADPSRTAGFAALDHAQFAILDIDYRPYSWASPREAGVFYKAAAKVCDMVVGNDEEFALFGPNPRAQAESLAQDGVRVVYKEGADGCTLLAQGQPPQVIAPYRVAAMKPFGAGDAFLGNGLAAMIAGAEPGAAFRRGAAAAALVVTRPGCASAMPKPPEIDDFLKERS